MNQLSLIFLWKSPLIGDFPASHVWLSEGTHQNHHQNINDSWVGDFLGETADFKKNNRQRQSKSLKPHRSNSSDKTLLDLPTARTQNTQDQERIRTWLSVRNAKPTCSHYEMIFLGNHDLKGDSWFQKTLLWATEWMLKTSGKKISIMASPFLAGYPTSHLSP